MLPCAAMCEQVQVNTDVVIIGGGPAGTAAAIVLARGGAQVMLVERERVPTHKVCGEFLSGEALLYLRRLGMDPSRLGGVPLNTIRLTGMGGVTERRLPFAAMSLTRLCLDAELLRHAESAGVHVRRGRAVERLDRVGDAWQASLASGEAILAGAVFLASGKHDVRGHPRPAGKQQGMIAFKMYWQLNAAERRSLGQAVELITYRGGYAGLQPVQDGIANLCCIVRAHELRRIGKWQDLVAHMCRESPHLRQRLFRAESLLAKPLTVASLPYGFVRRDSAGIWYLGDQAVVIPSFTGDGTSLALHTGMLAAHMFLRKESAHLYQQTVTRHVRRQVAIATAVSKMMVRIPRATMSLLRLWPGAVDVIARQTRIDTPLCIDQDAWEQH